MTNEKTQAFIAAVAAGQDFSRCDMVDLMLDGADLSGGLFHGADFSSLSIVDCRFVGADLSEADLSDTTLDRSNFTGANLTGACLQDAAMDDSVILDRAIGIYDAGRDPRGYRFLGVWQGDHWQVKAGCRWYRINDALDHWGPEDQDNKDAIARVRAIAAADPKGGAKPDVITPLLRLLDMVAEGILAMSDDEVVAEFGSRVDAKTAETIRRALNR